MSLSAFAWALEPWMWSGFWILQKPDKCEHVIGPFCAEKKAQIQQKMPLFMGISTESDEENLV